MSVILCNSPWGSRDELLKPIRPQRVILFISFGEDKEGRLYATIGLMRHSVSYRPLFPYR
jgi:hypothetical protein